MRREVTTSFSDKPRHIRLDAPYTVLASVPEHLADEYPGIAAIAQTAFAGMQLNMGSLTRLARRQVRMDTRPGRWQVYALARQDYEPQPDALFLDIARRHVG